MDGGKLLGSGITGGAGQGIAVAVSGDGNTAVVSAAGDSGGSGAFWIYTRSGSSWSPQTSKLVPTGTNGRAYVGYSAALSQDGNTALVGGYGDNSNTGAAWIFVRSGTSWSQESSKLVGTGAIFSANQGWSVALSGDGNTALVGGYNDSSGSGAAWVFTRTGGFWFQEAKLIGSGRIGKGNQGRAVALSADGNTALLGGNLDSSGQGATWVFIRSGGAWTQQSKLVGTGATGMANQGYSVSISSDGNTAAVGGRTDSSGRGATWVFARTGSTWSQTGQKLVGTGTAGTGIYQGTSVALSGDGNTLLVGAEGDNSYLGATWVFVRSGGVWTQEGAKLVGSFVGGSHQGRSLSVASDGNTALVGGPSDNSNAGASWVFVRSAGIWSQQAKIVAAGAVGGLANAGRPVALSGDGKTAVFIGDNDNAGIGSAWIFSRGSGSWKGLQPKISLGGPATNQDAGVAISLDGLTILLGNPGYDTSVGRANVWEYDTQTRRFMQADPIVATGFSGPARLGSAIAISADGNSAILGGPRDNTYRGAVWIFTRAAGTWAQVNKFLPTGAVGRALAGTSVAISADGSTFAFGGPEDNGRLGAVWVYSRTGGAWSFEGKLVPSDPVSPDPVFGSSVAIAPDGNTIFAGGPEDQYGGMWIFTRKEGAWTQLGSRFAGIPSAGMRRVGASLAVSSDGGTLIVGDDQATSSRGGFLVFKKYKGFWTLRGDLVTGDGGVGTPQQGSSVAVSSDGNVVLSGGPSDRYGFGAVWVMSARTAPTIASINDIAGDQGGKVRVTWLKSACDSAMDAGQVVTYGLWRKISGGASPARLKPPPQVIASVHNDTLGTKYDFVTSVPAVQSPSYNVISQTLWDSSAGDPHRTSFLVSAHTDDPNVFYLSPLDSGYSVDNIPPALITGASLTPEADGTMLLRWNANRIDQDLQGYHIYRSGSSGFSVDPQTRIASTTDTLYADTTAPHGVLAYYRVAAVDRHDNVGSPSSELSGTPVGVAEGKEVPSEFSLSQNYPNPFNPKTRINFACPQRSHVVLALFNLLGQEVAHLVEGDVEAGYHSVDLDGALLATGVYIYRIQAGSFTAVKKLVFVK